jgi:hypothetical protein
MNTYKFNVIDNQMAINDLMTKFNGFHDSCIKEIKYISGAFVDQNGAINPFDSIRTITAIFQSQGAIVKAIEMKFEKVVRLNLCPKGEMEDAVIYGASIVCHNGLLYWSSLCDIKLSELENNDYTWISSEKISWRALDNCLGDEIIY